MEKIASAEFCEALLVWALLNGLLACAMGLGFVGQTWGIWLALPMGVMWVVYLARIIVPRFSESRRPRHLATLVTVVVCSLPGASFAGYYAQQYFYFRYEPLAIRLGDTFARDRRFYYVPEYLAALTLVERRTHTWLGKTRHSVTIVSTPMYTDPAHPGEHQVQMYCEDCGTDIEDQIRRRGRYFAAFRDEAPGGPPPDAAPFRLRPLPASPGELHAYYKVRLVWLLAGAQALFGLALALDRLLPGLGRRNTEGQIDAA